MRMENNSKNYIFKCMAVAVMQLGRSFKLNLSRNDSQAAKEKLNLPHNFHRIPTFLYIFF